MTKTLVRFRNFTKTNSPLGRCHSPGVPSDTWLGWLGFFADLRPFFNFVLKSVQKKLTIFRNP